MERCCPKCGSKDIITERRINGDSQCKTCKFKGKTEEFDEKDELKEEEDFYKTLDVFLLSEAFDEVPNGSQTGATTTDASNMSQAVAVPQAPTSAPSAVPPTDPNATPPDDGSSDPTKDPNAGTDPSMGDGTGDIAPEDVMTTEIMKFDNIDLNIVNPKTSKFFSFDALRRTLKSINSLLDVQDKIILNDDSDVKDLRDIKDKTYRLKNILLKYIANFKSYEQAEIDNIRPIFDKIAMGLVKETRTKMKLVLK